MIEARNLVVLDNHVDDILAQEHTGSRCTVTSHFVASDYATRVSRAHVHAMHRWVLDGAVAHVQAAHALVANAVVRRVLDGHVVDGEVSLDVPIFDSCITGVTARRVIGIQVDTAVGPYLGFGTIPVAVQGDVVDVHPVAVKTRAPGAQQRE